MARVQSLFLPRKLAKTGYSDCENKEGFHREQIVTKRQKPRELSVLHWRATVFLSHPTGRLQLSLLTAVGTKEAPFPELSPDPHLADPPFLFPPKMKELKSDQRCLPGNFWPRVVCTHI